MTELTTGQRIADCRKKLGLSQEGLGEKMGVSRQAISKWEADAAMPDIDKLIFLSKLFSVSVGWLLGVEALPEPQPEAPQLTEELLHKIEEVVKCYQPKKKKLPLWAKAAIGTAAAAVLLWGGIKLRSEWQAMDARLSQLSARLSDSGNSNSTILNQLEDLQERIDSLSSAPENFSISDYSFQIEPDSGDATAAITISAIPGSWNEAFSASISVRLDGQQVVSQACHWDGTGLTSRLVLPLENGYEYWFTAQYADGTREQVNLSNSTAENLKRSFTISCHVTQGTGHFSLQKGTLELDGFDIHLARPNLTSGYDVDWAGAELILYHIRGSSRQIVDTYTLFDPEVHREEQSQGRPSEIGEFWSFPKGPFQLPELEDGDGLELWISAEMENGISLMQLVTSWAYLDGEFIAAVPADTAEPYE